MSIQSATPVSGSIVQRGETITVVWDATTSGGPPTVVYEPSGGGSIEVVYIGGATAFQVGYTGTQVYDGGQKTWTLTFKRNAGWGTSAFGIGVFSALTRNDLSYTIVAEGQYPPDMQPFNDPAETGGTAGILSIQDDGVGQGDATTLNFADNLTATVADSIATINGEAGGGGPGLDGIYGSIETDGVGGYTLSANSQGIASATLQIAEVRLDFDTSFGDDDFPVQATRANRSGQVLTTSDNIVTYAKDASGDYVVLRLFDAAGAYINPQTNAIAFDFFIGGATIEGGAGGSDITVIDETTTLTTGVTQFTYTGDGVTVTEDATSDEVTVTIPGQISGPGEAGIFGTITTDGADGAEFSSNSQGIAEATADVTGVTVTFEVPFSDTDYPVQVTTNYAPDVHQRFGLNLIKSTSSVLVAMNTFEGVWINPKTTAVDFDILVGGLGIGDGDVSSSVSSVGNQEFAIFDGTSGKIIKNSGTGIYQGGGSIHCTDAFIGVRLGVARAALGGSQAYLEVSEHTDSTPSGGTSYGRFWVKPANTPPVTPNNRPYYIANDGQNYDLSEGGGIGVHDLGGDAHTADTLANFNTKISDAALRVPGTHVTATDPVATAVDGDIWIEIT